MSDPTPAPIPIPLDRAAIHVTLRRGQGTLQTNAGLSGALRL